MKKITLNPDAEVVKTVKRRLKAHRRLLSLQIRNVPKKNKMYVQKNSGIRLMIRISKDFATACYITNPNSHPALPDDRITWNKRKFIWRTSL